MTLVHNPFSYEDYKKHSPIPGMAILDWDDEHVAKAVGFSEGSKSQHDADLKVYNDKLIEIAEENFNEVMQAKKSGWDDRQKFYAGQAEWKKWATEEADRLSEVLLPYRIEIEEISILLMRKIDSHIIELRGEKGE